MEPNVTIGMPTYNRIKYLPRAINCILSQTYENFEFIVYDDGSSDNTTKLLESYNDKRLSYVCFENKGPPAPLNYIYEKAKGDFIIILHDHDIFSNLLIENCVKVLKENPEAGFVLPGGGFVDSDGESNYVESLEELPLINSGRKHLVDIFSQNKSFNSRFHACSMVRREALEACGFFYNEKYGFFSDVDLWIRLLKNNDFLYLKQPLMKFTRREKDHQLNNRAVQITNTLFQIHWDNLKNFEENIFSANEVNNFLRVLKRRYFFTVSSIFLMELSKGNRLILKQFDIVDAENFNSSFLAFLFKILKFRFIGATLFCIRLLIKKLTK
tara:strand:- start:3083 stop:4063 length:981 start_codon:yes stop_codon:yes gene_type:complete